MGGDFWVAIFSESSKWVAIFRIFKIRFLQTRFFDFTQYDFLFKYFNPIFTFLNTTCYKKHFSKIIRVHKNLVK